MGDQMDTGTGSLADELGDVWADDVAEDQGNSFLDRLLEGSAEPRPIGEAQVSHEMEVMRDFGGMALRSPAAPNPEQQDREQSVTKLTLYPLANGESTSPSLHQTAEPKSQNDAVGFTDTDALPSSLSRRIADIEGLTRTPNRNDDALSENGGVIPRTTNALKNLGAQASIENGVTRIITAHASMSTHRTHKTRELFSHSHSLLFAPHSGNASLSEDLIDDILASIANLAACVQGREGGAAAGTGPNPLLSLQILVSNTTDLIYSLRGLSDVLQESKVTSTAAGRRLKSVRNLVTEIRMEEEMRTTGVRWIEEGDWDRRLRNREVGSSCRDVVKGFEQTCEAWRERLYGCVEAVG